MYVKAKIGVVSWDTHFVPHFTSCHVFEVAMSNKATSKVKDFSFYIYDYVLRRWGFNKIIRGFNIKAFRWLRATQISFH